jgi:hypothetical protein
MLRYVSHKVLQDYVAPLKENELREQHRIATDFGKLVLTVEEQHEMPAVDLDRFGVEGFNDETEVRLPNRRVLEKLCNSFNVSAGMPLSVFLPKRPVQALTLAQRREYIQMTSPFDSKPMRRSVISDSDSGERWYEYPIRIVDGLRKQPCLHSVSDMGPVGFPCLLFLYMELTTRGTFLWDRWHVITCEMNLGVAAAGLSLLKAQCAIEMNLRRMTFGKDVNEAKLWECGKEMFGTISHTHPVFELLAMDIAFALGMGKPKATGDTWLKAMFAAARKVWLESCKGFEAKSGRWFSFECRGKGFRLLRPIQQCVVVYYGFRVKWWKTLDQCPLRFFCCRRRWW